MSDDVDFAAEGLLNGLEGEAREGRVRLLRRLHDEGVPLEELRKAVEEQRLVLLPVERALRGEDLALTLDEVAERGGVDPAAIEGMLRTWGLPVPGRDDATFGQTDLDQAERLKKVLDLGVPMEGWLDVSRVMGRGMAQLAAAMRTLVGGAFLRPGDREDELAERYVAAMREMLPLLAPALEHLFALHLLEILRGDVVGAAEIESGAINAGRERTTAFADLVGFTRLGGRVPPEELGQVARRLEQLAGNVVNPPVRIVKSIGDAVLLSSPDPEPILEVSFDLLEVVEAEGEGFPQLHVGVDSGPTLERDGDIYGHPVNVASRLSDTAKPGSVLTTERVKEAVSNGAYEWSYAGARKLRGVSGEVKLFRVRRAKS